LSLPSPSLFAGIDGRVSLELLSAESTRTGDVILTYRT
jgi:hypothetical protein